MSKFGAFVAGFGTGMTQARDWQEHKKKAEREEERYQREKRLQGEEDAYRADLAAAGKTLVNGTSGVGGVRVGSQQDAQLAEQNMVGEGVGSGGNQPVTGGFGIMRDTAMRHGRVADAAQFADIQAKEDARGQEEEWKKGRQALMAEYQKTGKTRQDALNFYRAVGQHDFRYGKAQLGDLTKVDETAEKLKKEGVFDALQHYWATGDLKGTLDKFDAVGDQKIDRKTVQTRIVKDPVTGQDTPIIKGSYQDGQSFSFDPERLSHMVGGYEGYLASRKQAIDAKDKDAGRKHQADTLDETRRHNMAMEGIGRMKADGDSTKSVGKFKDLSPDDIKSSFQTYRDVVKPASGVGGKSTVVREPVVDQAALAQFRSWARAKGYADMNMALRDWDAEGRPSANAQSQVQKQRAPGKPFNPADFMRQ